MLGSKLTTQQGIPGRMHHPVHGQSQDKGGQEKSDKSDGCTVNKQQYLQMLAHSCRITSLF